MVKVAPRTATVAPAVTPVAPPPQPEMVVAPAPVEVTPAPPPPRPTGATAKAARANFASQANQTRHITQSQLPAGGSPAKYAFSPSVAEVRAGTATIQRNHGGPPVRSLQEQLNASGASPRLDTDGKFGPKTQAAVREFQRTHELPVTGVVDMETQQALDTAPPAQPRTPVEPSPQTPRPQTPTTPQQPGAPTSPGVVDGTTLPATGNAFMDSIAADAIRTQRETGVPASVTMAQAMLESGSGSSGLTKRANNYFGIKGEGPAGHVTMRTREVVNGENVFVDAKFRAYHSAEESFTDHARLLSTAKRYSTAMSHANDAEQFARDIQTAGYATDPRYATSLIRIMRQYDLTRFDAVGRQPNPG